MTQPLDLAGRKQVRGGIDARARWLADRERATNSRSIKCSGRDWLTGPRHAGDPGGCANDGTGCICECHDPEVRDA